VELQLHFLPTLRMCKGVLHSVTMLKIRGLYTHRRLYCVKLYVNFKAEVKMCGFMLPFIVETNDVWS
jgi:hypothetical protein